MRPTFNNITEHVLLLRDAGSVKRSHTCRTLMTRNVAEHSHGVAMLVITLSRSSGYMPRVELLAAALCHDLSEIATGDVPAPVKRDNPELKRELNLISSRWEIKHFVRYELTKDEAELLLWCDRMDFALYALEEVTMGNRFFEEYLVRITDWIGDMPIPAPYSDAAEELLAGVMDAVGHELGIKTLE